jgi:hypothetical protein
VELKPLYKTGQFACAFSYLLFFYCLCFELIRLVAEDSRLRCGGQLLVRTTEYTRLDNISTDSGEQNTDVCGVSSDVLVSSADAVADENESDCDNN